MNGYCYLAMLEDTTDVFAYCLLLWFYLWGQNTDKENERHSLFVNLGRNGLLGENYTRNQVNRTILVTIETEKENEQALSILSRWTEVDAVITPEILFKGAKLYIKKKIL